MKWKIKKYQNIMTHLDFETTNETIKLNLDFNRNFINEIESGLITLSYLKALVINKDTNWLTEAEQNVQKELMSWKDKK